MTGPNANFVTGGLIGLGVQNGNDGNTPKFGLGTTVEGNGNSRWLYVVSQTAITQYDCVKVTPSYVASSISTANAVLAGNVGFAQVAFVTSDYGWVMISGKPVVRLAASAVDDQPLFTTATSGVLGTSTATLSMYQIMGVMADSSASAGGVTAVSCNASWPIVRFNAAGGI